MSEPAATLAILAPQPVPDHEHLAGLALAGIASPNSRRAYAQAVRDFLAWWQADRRGPLSKLLVEAYRAELEARGLAPSTANIRLSAIRKLVNTAAGAGLIAPALAAAIGQVRGVRKLGARAGNWLTREQASALLRAPDPATLKGKRDRAVLGLLIGCGLRRAELAALDVAAIQQREARWVVIDLVGKGRRVRTVPVPAWVKVLVDNWLAAAGLETGKVLRPIDKAGHLSGNSVTPRSSGGSFSITPAASGSTAWRPMTCAAPARNSAARQAATSNRSSSCLAMPRFRPRNNTSALARI